MDNFIVLSGVDLQPDMAKIPMVRIDDVIDGAMPCVMKMDVEGFEMQALKGATQLLEMSKSSGHHCRNFGLVTSIWSFSRGNP